MMAAANLLGSSQQQFPDSFAAGPTPRVPGHAGSAVLLLSAAGSAGQLLCLSVVTAGAIPCHLLPPAPPAPPAPQHKQRQQQKSTQSAAAAAAAASGAATTINEGCAPIELIAARSAWLDIGSCIQQVAVKLLPPGHLVQPTTPLPAAAAAAASKNSQQEQQQTMDVPVGLVLVRCMYKLYIAAVVVNIRRPATPEAAAAAATATAAMVDADGGCCPMEVDDDLQAEAVQQQQQQGGKPVNPTALSSSSSSSSSSSAGYSWRLVPCGVGRFPEPLLTAEWHPQLQQVTWHDSAVLN
jgi:hypothetical protein